jgi:hypothetical protein
MSEEESVSAEIEREREIQERQRIRSADEIRRQVLNEYLDPKERRRIELRGEYVNEDGEVIKV